MTKLRDFVFSDNVITPTPRAMWYNNATRQCIPSTLCNQLSHCNIWRGQNGPFPLYRPLWNSLRTAASLISLASSYPIAHTTLQNSPSQHTHSHASHHTLPPAYKQYRVGRKLPLDRHDKDPHVDRIPILTGSPFWPDPHFDRIPMSTGSSCQPDPHVNRILMSTGSSCRPIRPPSPTHGWQLGNSLT